MTTFGVFCFPSQPPQPDGSNALSNPPSNPQTPPVRPRSNTSPDTNRAKGSRHFPQLFSCCVRKRRIPLQPHSALVSAPKPELERELSPPFDVEAVPVAVRAGPAAGLACGAIPADSFRSRRRRLHR